MASLISPGPYRAAPPAGFRDFEALELPFVGNSVGAKTAPAVWEFYERFCKDELKDVKVLAVWGFGQGVLFTKDVVIKSPSDAKGLKLRASNRMTNDAFTLLGAQTQSIPPPGVPEALAKGVLDGVVFPYDAVIPFKLDELTNRVSEFSGDRNFYNSVMLFVMNKAKYDSLPDDLKKIIDANSGAALAAELGRKWDEWDAIGRAAVTKRGTPIHVIDGPDLAAWKKAVEPLYKSWVAERDKAGDNGAELLKTAQELIAKHSQ